MGEDAPRVQGKLLIFLFWSPVQLAQSQKISHIIHPCSRPEHDPSVKEQHGLYTPEPLVAYQDDLRFKGKMIPENRDKTDNAEKNVQQPVLARMAPKHPLHSIMGRAADQQAMQHAPDYPERRQDNHESSLSTVNKLLYSKL